MKKEFTVIDNDKTPLTIGQLIGLLEEDKPVCIYGSCGKERVLNSDNIIDFSFSEGSFHKTVILKD